ncbi:MAG: type VI secretion system baseplate subunit TssF [Paludibaculum sp.]
MRDDLLQYYEKELSFLRRMGAEFAERYPKIASRLVLEPNKCEDPHVERLLEGFAFLAARVRLKIDDEFPEITEALLNILFPHYLRPLPSMSIAEFQVDAEQVKPESGFTIERGAVLSSRPVGGAPCKFRTSYDLTFWPVEVAAADWRTQDRVRSIGEMSGAAGVVRLVLRCQGDLTFGKLALDRLRFYLDGESSTMHTLYEVLSNNCVQIIVRDTAAKSNIKPLILPPDALRPMGFEEDEAVLPYPRRSFSGYQIIQEYFAFPQKFLFFELSGLDAVCQAGFQGSVEIAFVISPFERSDRRQALEVGINARTFRLNCTPIINLFPHTAEPILLDHTRYEYHVIPDVNRRTALEIFSVEEVASVNPDSEEVTVLEPLYSFRHADAKSANQVFWYTRRGPATLRNDNGTEIYLSISNAAGKHTRPKADVLNVRTICSNRDLPGSLPFGNESGDFTLDAAAPVKRIVALRKPTTTVRAPQRKNLFWRMISMFSLNYLSLVEEGGDAFREMLRLYNFAETSYGEKQIEGLTALRSRREFAPVVYDDGTSFARGTHISMEFDEEQFVGEGVFLFAAVLERFLGLYVSLNSFTQLEVRTKQRKEVLREWPPRTGRRVLI